MEIIIDIPDSRVIDLFISACGGGSNYWCKSIVPNQTGKQSSQFYMLREGFVIHDGETNQTISVTPGMIRKALNLFLIETPIAFAEWISENDDAETADVFLQLCTFGKVIYG